eukprot:CAMPEP_0171093170 /NCGR_PEP_ID=MMETSP0766_2-20121228/38919_1 /TAXON_ID=439317 /ORGANISM="Gambierdiscus australes, Strain CAWD 149" /LENGTH=314 /DNA_ID=CAMNT_0011551567 /DNA_START=27 /DNA_END=971 /DNA_ORIENTATION=-
MDSNTLRYVVPLAVVVAAGIWLVLSRAPKVFLEKKRKRVQITDIVELSHDTKRFRLSLGSKSTILGLPTGKHISICVPNPKSCATTGKWNGKDDPDKGRDEVERKYTPVTGNETAGHVDLVIKIYRPGTVRMPDGKELTWADGGKCSLFLDSKKPGDFIEINGPLGLNEYLGKGSFKVPGRTVTVRKVGMLAGGTGLTPMLQVARAALMDKEDSCSFSLLYANKTEGDILCRDMLDELSRSSGGRFTVTYTLDFPPSGWQHKVGFITQEMIKECLPGPSDDTLILMCGPPPMIEFACKKNLEALGYAKNSMVAF